jgi:tRNA U34 5-carboxymethylaminomethyl modifying GTPase MnmE/TrmE
MEPRRSSALNENQQRRLIVTCQYVDRLLADLERSFVEAQSNSPFGRYANDLAPAEQRLVTDYIARIRRQLLRMLEGQDLSPSPSKIGLRHSILTHLTFVDVAVEELKPHYMEGYGEVSPDAKHALNGIVEELHGTIRQLTTSLSADRDGNLRSRLAAVSDLGDLGVLTTLEEVIARYGLVEFRSPLATILDTLQRHGLELAVFGRVSTGKSSLLNRLLERDVLPVGVTPITAVPTRITFGTEPRVRVWFADARPRELQVSQLAEFASERENPANLKRVLRLVVELPARFLEPGVTLVDTPGLGSLATAGATETLAYLPQCDAAAVLIDASSTVTVEDLATVALLVSAGIRVSVLLSKADLLTEHEREAATEYTRQTLTREFRTAIPVAAVSLKPEFEGLFERWREDELAPLIAGQERERRKTAARKTELLRAQVEAALIRRSKSGASVSSSSRGDFQTADSTLQTAAGQITVLERRLDAEALELTRRGPEVLRRAAELIDLKVDSRSALAQAFREVTSATAGAIARDLQDLRASLIHVQGNVSASVQFTTDTVEDMAIATRRFREVPVPELPPELEVPPEGLERLLGHGLARSLLTKRLEQAVGDAVRTTLDSYSAVLRRWALDRLDDVRNEWTAATDALRADLDRRLGHSERTPVDLVQIEKDLQRVALTNAR